MCLSEEEREWLRRIVAADVEAAMRSNRLADMLLREVLEIPPDVFDADLARSELDED